MKERQEDYRPPLAETRAGEPEVNAAEEAALPSVEDLEARLRDAESVATSASVSEKEIDEMIERRQESLDRLRDISSIQESRLRKVENFNPLKDLEPDDYERLVREGIVDNAYAQRYKATPAQLISYFQKRDKVITDLEKLEYPTANAIAELERLVTERNRFRQELESLIAERQEEIAARREEIKNKLLEHYTRRAEELERTIAEIESNPRVIERLRTMAEKERQAFQAKIEQEWKKIIQEAGRYIQSLGARHVNVFKRLGELTGNEKIAEELLQILREGDERKMQSALDKIRSRLIDAIIDGEGERQLKDPKEIVPWRVGPTSIRYSDAMKFLLFQETEKTLRAAAEAGNEQAKKLLEQRERIIAGNEIIRKLVGPQWITDRRTNKRRMGAFWAAFETRKKNDEEGITAARKREREEAAKREAAFEKSAKEIIKRGGFVVQAPVIKEVRGKRVVVGKQKCAVRLEKGKSPKGNEFWKVVEVFGEIKGLKVGDVSPLDMRSFPQWFRESAKPYFVMRGEDFVERLVYEEEK
jgi:hypothetical protein